jgi:hypothetical protein
MKIRTYAPRYRISTVDFEYWLEARGVSESRADRIGNFLQQILDSIWNNRIWGATEREHKIKIEHFDTWSFADTLAPSILQLLIQYKSTLHGAPHVDDCDVPDHLKSTAAPPVGTYDHDDLFFDRFNWILDEMIWAFNEIIKDDAFDKFTINTGVFREDIFGNMVDTQTDLPAWKAHEARVQHATTMFGKYFRGLWD